jgi:hypothetical protein
VEPGPNGLGPGPGSRSPATAGAYPCEMGRCTEWGDVVYEQQYVKSTTMESATEFFSFCLFFCVITNSRRRSSILEHPNLPFSSESLSVDSDLCCWLFSVFTRPPPGRAPGPLGPRNHWRSPAHHPPAGGPGRGVEAPLTTIILSESPSHKFAWAGRESVGQL